MKFILACVPCCRSPIRPDISEAVPQPVAEEAGFLVPSYTLPSVPPEPMPRYRRKRRRRRYGSSLSSLDGWRPTLDAIYEDDDVILAVDMETNSPPVVFGSECVANLKVVPNPRRVPLRDYSDDNYRPDPVPAMVPAFTTSTFFF